MTTGRRCRVLYVDDDEGLRRLVGKALDRRGYDVTLASDGEQGLELARSGDFDVIALDHYMPGQGGFTTLQAILTTIQDPPPIVYVTGSEETRVAVDALKAGAADYVVKTVGEDFFDLLENAFAHAMEQVRLRREHAEAEAALRAGHQRLEVMLREVNHRVANSLQLVMGMVHMQASHVADPAARAALEDTKRRIAAIGQVHRRLYTADNVEAVDMQPYLEAMVRELEETFSAPGAPRRLVLGVDPVQLQTDRAISLGVIVNELVSNACKYAYGPSEAGEVRVGLTEAPGAVVLTVEDQGRGMTPGAAPMGTGLGGRLIAAMAKSLRADLTYDPGHRGVRAVVRVPA
ncbi:sensor histidine kinase [Phenylobacterium sp. VNQ135]|uniref:sensor histidine kinase n=1 Tax=Phenylobacterium sp. VNQ135 TaxID=3400922 RepID=UPI003C065F5D